MRISSPPPNISTGRGSSLQPSPRTAQFDRRNLSLGHARELDRQHGNNSRESVNFSLPSNLQRRVSDVSSLSSIRRAESLTMRRDTTTVDWNEMVFDPNTRTFMPRGQLMAYESGLMGVRAGESRRQEYREQESQRQGTALQHHRQEPQRHQQAQQQPVMRKKSLRRDGAGREGSHLAEGTVGGRMRGIAVEAIKKAEPETKPVSLPRTLRQRETSQSGDTAPSQPQQRKERTTGTSAGMRSPSDAESESSVITKPSRKALGKRPSVVQEQREPAESLDETVKVLGHQASMRSVSSEATSPVTPEAVSKETQQQASSAPVEEPLPVPHAHPAELPVTDQPLKPGSNLAKLVVERQMREASISPTRKPQFLSPSDAAGMRHEPPSRSISPRKSALKHSTSSASPRGMSPLGEKLMTGEVSDASTNPSDDRLGVSGPGIVRKKSVRVSFDEGSNVVVPEPEELMPARRIWSGGSYRNRSNSPLEEEEFLMGPRPSLPVFGSVRKRELSRESHDKDRPLVKPHEHRDTAQSSSLLHLPGSSSDHAVGAIISHDVTSKQPLPPFSAPASSELAQADSSREPLPPLVTSVEGSGYNTTPSDSGSSSENLEGESVLIEEATAVEIPQAEREALRTQDSMARARLIEDVSDRGSGHSTPTYESQRVSKPQQEGGAIAKVTELPPTSSHEDNGRTERQRTESLPFTPPEDEDFVTLAVKASRAALANGVPPSLVVTVSTPQVEQKVWTPQVPGGWDSDEAQTPTPTTENQQPSYQLAQQQQEQELEEQPQSILQSIEAEEVTPATLGIAEPEPLPHRPGSPVVGEIAEEAAYGPERTRRGSISAHSEASTNESIYSDAAEQLTDHEGDGFQSLDAVVESPTSKIVPGFVAPVPTSPPRSPTKVKQATDDLEGWERTQRYWMSLSDEKKRELEAEARRLAEEEADEEDMEIQQSPILRPAKLQQQVQPIEQVFEQPPDPEREVSPDRIYQIAPGAKAGPNGAPASAPVKTMRGSLRQPKQQPQEPKGVMRQSLRGEPANREANRAPARAAGTAISASRANANTRSLTKPAPSVSAETQAYTKALAVAQERAAQRKAAEQGPPQARYSSRQLQAEGVKLQRSNSADSSSSFKRERSGGNGFFRSSKRQQPEQIPSLRTRAISPPKGEKGRRFSVRSLSPAGRQPSVTSASAAAHITTLRGNRGPAAQPSPIYETPLVAKTKHGLFGRKKDKASPTVAGPSSSGFFSNSRFADSDSDIDAPARPTVFKSRFADSSDDEDSRMPAPSLSGSMGSRSFRQPAPPAPRDSQMKKSLRGNGYDKDIEEDIDTDIEDEATRLNTLRNQQQGIEAQAAAKGVNPQAILLAQQYFGNGGLPPRPQISAATNFRHSSFGPVTPTAGAERQTAPYSAPPQRSNTSPNASTPNFRTPPKKEKGGLMSILRRKRPDSQAKIGKQTSESGARKDTPLERNRADLEAVRKGEELPPLSMPKLRKKGAPMQQIEAQPAQMQRAGFFQPEVTGGTMNARDDVEEELRRRPSTSDGVEINGVERRLNDAPTASTSTAPAQPWQKPGMLRRNTGSMTQQVEFKSGQKKEKKGFFKRLFEH